MWRKTKPSTKEKERGKLHRPRTHTSVCTIVAFLAGRGVYSAFHILNQIPKEASHRLMLIHIHTLNHTLFSYHAMPVHHSPFQSNILSPKLPIHILPTPVPLRPPLPLHIVLLQRFRPTKPPLTARLSLRICPPRSATTFLNRLTIAHFFCGGHALGIGAGGCGFGDLVGGLGACCFICMMVV